MNCLKAHLFKVSPIPFIYKAFNKTKICFDTLLKQDKIYAKKV